MCSPRYFLNDCETSTDFFSLFCHYTNTHSNRFYWILYLIFFVLLPINAPLEYWDDSIQAALFVTFSLRYLIVLNISWLITSAHFIWGLDKKHKPSDSNMIFLVTKSYWPQYHYLLPFDYQTGEFGNYGKLLFISIHICVRLLPKLDSECDLMTLLINIRYGCAIGPVYWRLHFIWKEKKNMKERRKKSCIE